MPHDTRFMQEAFNLAIKAQQIAEVPIGAIVVFNNQIIGRGWNQPLHQCDPTAHAEIIALREAAKCLGNYRLINCSLYVTLEPCIMCVGAIIHARIQRLIFGAFDPKTGMAGSVLNLFEAPQVNHRVEITYEPLDNACGKLLKDFFQGKR